MPMAGSQTRLSCFKQRQGKTKHDPAIGFFLFRHDPPTPHSLTSPLSLNI